MVQRKKKRIVNAAEASKQSQSEEKTPKTLKPEPKIAKRSPNQNLTKSKESNASLNVQGKPEKANNKAGKKEDTADKKNENARANKKRDQDKKEKLGGLIFMCNRNTKPDCYRYMVMGLPESKRELVKSVKPGLKLFLYDFDAKLLYGVYKASSAGGMKLEPSAFNGSYPAQVRFKVDMDCLPLSDGVFKKAIQNNYDAKKNWFDVELTVQQVNKLVRLFRPANQLQSNALAVAPSLQRGPVLLAPPTPITPAVEAPMHRLPYAVDESRRYYVPPVHIETPPTEKETAPRDPLSLSEKDYRKYGLRPPAPASVPAPALDPSHGHREINYPHGAVPDRYALEHRRTPYLRDPSRRRVEETAENRLRQVAKQSSIRSVYHPADLYGGRDGEAGRSHFAYAADALSDYNRRHRLPGGSADPGFLPVSSRYLFAGPPE